MKKSKLIQYILDLLHEKWNISSIFFVLISMSTAYSL